MNEKPLHIASISRLSEVFGTEKITHPLIAVMDTAKWKIDKEWVRQKLTLGMYYISLKDKSCGMDYGRNAYDFDEGVLAFAAPDQLITLTKELEINELNGWILFFHPDLIRHTPLGNRIGRYKFFSYDVHEALHLSEDEQRTITDCKNIISDEIKERIDAHSQTVIASALELLLNLSQRYYERQFLTRSAQNSDTADRFHSLLEAYYKDGNFAEKGIPSIEYFSNKLHFFHQLPERFAEKTNRNFCQRTHQ
ncbi:MAG: AraC family transcriptional regulator [Cruoricaptor ignavus]|nr:AraC family transcriptional regulator [Cruoricaptor ignavus]